MLEDSNTFDAELAGNGSTPDPVLYEDTSLPTVVIVYIVVGCLAGVAIILALTTLYVERKQRSRKVMLGFKQNGAEKDNDRFVSTHIMMAIAERQQPRQNGDAMELTTIHEEAPPSYQI